MKFLLKISRNSRKSYLLYSTSSKECEHQKSSVLSLQTILTLKIRHFELKNLGKIKNKWKFWRKHQNFLQFSWKISSNAEEANKKRERSRKNFQRKQNKKKQRKIGKFNQLIKKKKTSKININFFLLLMFLKTNKNLFFFFTCTKKKKKIK